MSEYTGRATRGITVNLVWGVTFLAIAILFTILMIFYTEKPNVFQVFLTIFLWFFSALMFIFLHSAMTTKKLVVNDIGIFLYSGNRLMKKIYWNEVKAIASTSLPGKYPRTGFVIIGNKSLNINDRDVLGPVDTLKKAFREIAEIAAKKGIPIDDFLGWAPSIVGGLEEVNPDDLKGRWHKVHHANYRKMIGSIAGIIITGILITSSGYFISTEYRSVILLVGGIILISGILLFIGMIYATMYFPDEIYFDDSGIKTKSLRGKIREIPWYRIRNVACVEETGVATICDISLNCIIARVDSKVCKALKIMFKKHKP